MQTDKIKQILKQDIKEIQDLKEKDIKEIFFRSYFIFNKYSCCLCILVSNDDNNFTKTIREIQFKTFSGLKNFENSIKDLNLNIEVLK